MKVKQHKNKVQNSNSNKFDKKFNFTKSKKKKEGIDFSDLSDTSDMDEKLGEGNMDEDFEHEDLDDSLNMGDEDENEEDINEEEDESEDDTNAPRVTGGKITMSLIHKWETELDEKTNVVSTLKQVQQALSAAVESIKGSENVNVQSRYVVKGPQIFNAVIRVCLNKAFPSLQRLFELKTLSDRPVKNKKWKKLLGTIQKYLKDFMLLMKAVSEPTVIQTLLKKGVLPLLPFYSEFSALSWRLTKHLSVLWCTSQEVVRVLSVVALLRVLRAFNEEKRDKALKLLYISYVNNCRFTSPSSWPMIDFMRMSLTELYGMDQSLAYRHAFIYIRQLAFHLRNAMIVQKKERLQLVYNWQYVHCIHLWADLITKTHPSPVLKELIYPLTMISKGVMDFMKSSSYFPLTFHVCTILTDLAHKTGVFIPVLPHLLQILSSHPLRSRPTKNALKPLQWDCIIKVSKSQVKESCFPDGLIDQFFFCSLHYLSTRANTIGFPEQVFPYTLQVKAYLKKKCKQSSYSKKLKQLLEKVAENGEFILKRRADVTFGIADAKEIKNWEIETMQANPPLHSFFLQWRGIRDEIKKREVPLVKGEGEDAFSISALRKRQKERTEMDEEFAEEEEDEDSPPQKKRKEDDSKQTKKNKKSQSDIDDKGDVFEDDIVQEMRLSDYEEEEEDDQ